MKKIIIALLLCLIPSVALGLTYTVKKATDQGDPNTYGSAAFMAGVAGSKVATLKFPHSSNATNTSYVFGTGITFPSTLSLEIEPGALISVPTGSHHVVIGKLKNPGAVQIFNDPNGMVTFGTGAVSEVYPGWWGDSISAISNAQNEYAKQKITNYLPSKIVDDITVGDEATDGQGIFLMSTFSSINSPSQEKMYLCSSPDGKDFNMMSVLPFFSDESPYTVRDPSLVFYKNKYWVVYSTGPGSLSTSFGLISSPDLNTWTKIANVDTTTGDPTINRTWAPCWFIDTDNSIHVIVTMSNDSGVSFSSYELHPTNDAFTTWSIPMKMTGTALPNMIDAFMLNLNGVYYLWYKNETTKYIEYATSTNLTSGYVVIKSGDWAGWGDGLEGECLVKLNSDTWRIYFDKYTAQGIYYSESSDNFATWSEKQLIKVKGMIPCHPTILRCREMNVLRHILATQINGALLAQKAFYTVPYDGGLVALMEEETLGHFIGTVSPNKGLYIDMRDPNGQLHLRTYNGSVWREGITISNGGIRFNEYTTAGILYGDANGALMNNYIPYGDGLRLNYNNTPLVHFIGTISPNKGLYVDMRDPNSSMKLRTYNGSSWVDSIVSASNGAIQFGAYGAGTLVTDASGHITASSDERLKNIQKEYLKGLDVILKIKPIIYKWNNNSGLDTQHEYIGFSAQKLQKILPEAIGMDKRGYLTLSDRSLIGALVNAVKELNEQLQLQEQQIKKILKYKK